jgi:hypothetical protein
MVHSGVKVKPVDTYWVPDHPEEGQRSLFRCDTEEIVRSEPMDLFDVPKNEDGEEVEEATFEDVQEEGEEQKWD